MHIETYFPGDHGFTLEQAVECIGRGSLYGNDDYTVLSQVPGAGLRPIPELLGDPFDGEASISVHVYGGGGIEVRASMLSPSRATVLPTKGAAPEIREYDVDGIRAGLGAYLGVSLTGVPDREPTVFGEMWTFKVLRAAAES